MQEQDVHPCFVMGILDSITGDGFGETAWWEEILAQAVDRDAPMMGFFGEKIQHAFIVARFFYQIVQHQHATLRQAKPALQVEHLQ